MTLKIGDVAFDFSIPISDNKNVNLSDLKGKFIILYFYPKDDTPGCTIEARDFNKLKPEFEKLNAVIIGVSKDNLNSHNKFKEKYCLEFELASDANSDMCEQYGVWVQKSMFGKKYMGINRATFLIDTQGKILHIWPAVDVKNHAQDVLERLKAENK
ncbi:thioredoxin-dependent thiol peroxidase [Rickettsia endosymbiont of Halotydeus destructor]|uniref:thioredoxin-dependent thiol peroxidase n=1 Tax=Rickettsia endosymbiont of Halotydeus destructor TaxID=2996754 RepID=UPI003BAF6D96